MKNKTYIIAEAGVNHNGSIDIAKKLIDVASDAGVDAVKFQTFKAENLVTKQASKCEYQTKNTTDSESQLEMLKKLELTDEMHKELIKHCKNKNIEFLSTPFDIESVVYLINLGLEAIKIPSGEITNLPYLEFIGKLNKKIILSSGMSNIEEIKSAVEIIVQAGTKKENITVLHCTTQYPAPFNSLNLLAIKTIKDEIAINVGYSDHSEGIEASIASVAIGANVIEKHFTLDKTMEGPDHKASIEPDELKQMVTAIRNIEVALGNGIKTLSKEEENNIKIVRKSIVASEDIQSGESFSCKNLTVKRPALGVSPLKWYDIIGKKAQKSYKKDDLIDVSEL